MLCWTLSAEKLILSTHNLQLCGSTRLIGGFVLKCVKMNIFVYVVFMIASLKMGTIINSMEDKSIRAGLTTFFVALAFSLICRYVLRIV